MTQPYMINTRRRISPWGFFGLTYGLSWLLRIRAAMAGIVWGCLAILFAACTRATIPATAPTVPPTVAAVVPPTTLPTVPPSMTGLTSDQARTLASLEQADPYPLYTMHYYGAYTRTATAAPYSTAPAWGCSLFAALGDPDNRLYGRNFDWDYSPALLLFTTPPDGYASVSMVDIAYLDFTGAAAKTLLDLPLAERQALLNAPFLPFDGMNARGLAIGMAAVPPSDVRPDPQKETRGSLGIIREMLDHAATVDQAVTILQSYTIDFEGGPPLHYLIADATGRAALVEFYQGETVVTPNTADWHLATNFLCAAVESTAGECWRYDALNARLTAAQGRLTPPDALSLLRQVAQNGTQWSIVYGISTGEIAVAINRAYDVPHTFRLDMTDIQRR